MVSDLQVVHGPSGRSPWLQKSGMKTKCGAETSIAFAGPSRDGVVKLV
jgi:hypothetical protein